MLFGALEAYDTSISVQLYLSINKWYCFGEHIYGVVRLKVWILVILAFLKCTRLGIAKYFAFIQLLQSNSNCKLVSDIVLPEKSHVFLYKRGFSACWIVPMFSSSKATSKESLVFNTYGQYERMLTGYGRLRKIVKSTRLIRKSSSFVKKQLNVFKLGLALVLNHWKFEDSTRGRLIWVTYLGRNMTLCWFVTICEIVVMFNSNLSGMQTFRLKILRHQLNAWSVDLSSSSIAFSCEKRSTSSFSVFFSRCWIMWLRAFGCITTRIWFRNEWPNLPCILFKKVSRRYICRKLSLLRALLLGILISFVFFLLQLNKTRRRKKCCNRWEVTESFNVGALKLCADPAIAGRSSSGQNWNQNWVHFRLERYNSISGYG